MSGGRFEVRPPQGFPYIWYATSLSTLLQAGAPGGIFVQGGGYVVTSDIVRTLALLGHMMPLSEYGSVEDTVLATWLLGWGGAPASPRSFGG